MHENHFVSKFQKQFILQSFIHSKVLQHRSGWLVVIHLVPCLIDFNMSICLEELVSCSVSIGKVSFPVSSFAFYALFCLYSYSLHITPVSSFNAVSLCPFFLDNISKLPWFCHSVSPRECTLKYMLIYSSFHTLYSNYVLNTRLSNH